MREARMESTDIKRLVELLATVDEEQAAAMLAEISDLPVEKERGRLYEAITKEAGVEAALVVMEKLDPARFQITERIRRLDNARQVASHPLSGMMGGP
jgi:hypothetical protein